MIIQNMNEFSDIYNISCLVYQVLTHGVIQNYKLDQALESSPSTT